MGKSGHIYEKEDIGKIAYFQIESINSNRECPLLPVTCYRNRNKYVFNYDFREMVPLDSINSDLFSDKSFLVKLLVSFAKCIIWCEEHFLDPYNIQGSLACIYCREIKSECYDEKDYHFIYLPVEKNNGNDPIKSLMEEIYSRSRLFLPGEENQNIEFEFLDTWDLNNFSSGLEELKKLVFSKSEASHKSVSVKYGKNIIIPVGIILFEMLLALFSFIILKNMSRFGSSVFPAIVVSLFILICISLDIIFLLSSNGGLRNGFADMRNFFEHFLDSYVEKGKKHFSDSPNKNPKTGILYECMPGSGLEDRGEKVYIVSDDFIIGNNPEKSDFTIDCKDINAVHARIIKKQNVFFIEDEGSVKGTYLNGERLKKQREYMLRDKSIVRFASREYYFSSD